MPEPAKKMTATAKKLTMPSKTRGSYHARRHDPDDLIIKRALISARDATRAEIWQRANRFQSETALPTMEFAYGELIKIALDHIDAQMKK